MQPRMSLLGKPISYNRGSRRDVRYRRLQARVYNFLERPRGIPAVLYHILVFFMVFTCLALSVFSTIKEYEKDAVYLLLRMEILVVILFALEFFLRLWSSGCRSRYQGCLGRLKFLKRPFCIIDIITIIASVVVLGMGTSGQVFATSALRGLRFFQILRMVRMDRRGGTWKLLGSVVYAHRQELITTMYIGFLGLIFASFLVYLMEKDVNEKFSNFAQALWWGVITLCTVGYGDMVPETWQGKLIASFCALMGISFFALPAGILGSGFALKVQQQQRQKHMIRRRQPAATLIQALWRCYAADEHSISVATWKIHQVPLPSPPVSRSSSSFKQNASFVARLPTIRRHKSQTIQSPGESGNSRTARGTRYSRAVRDVNASVENLETNSLKEFFFRSRWRSCKHASLQTDDGVLKSLCGQDEEDEPRCTQLTNQHKCAIRFLRKLKYFVARRKFKEALKPYDVKDVMEQYAAGHVDLLGRVKNLHNRLDQILGQQGSKAKDVYASKISLASRVVKVERQVADIEEKLDTLIKVYMEDRERLLALPISNQPIKKSNLKQSVTSDIRNAGVTLPDYPAIDSPQSVQSLQVEQQTQQNYEKTSSANIYAISGDVGQVHQEHNDACTINIENKRKKRVTLRSALEAFDRKNYKEKSSSVVIPITDPLPFNANPQPPPESSIILIDDVEDYEEEDLNCEGELDQYPSWEMDTCSFAEADADADVDCDDTENAALLSNRSRTTIVITPISPVSSAHDLKSLEEQTDSTSTTTTTTTINKSNYLSPDSGGYQAT